MTPKGDTEVTPAGTPEGEPWLTLKDAAAAAGVSVSALRKWYGRDQIPSRMEPGPTGPRRVVPLEAVLERARRTAPAAATAPPVQDEAEIVTKALAPLMEQLVVLTERLADAQEQRAQAEKGKVIAEHDALRSHEERARLRQQVADLEEKLAEASRRWWRRRSGSTA